MIANAYTNIVSSLLAADRILEIVPQSNLRFVFLKGQNMNELGLFLNHDTAPNALEISIAQ
jgi:hypothetical protein